MLSITAKRLKEARKKANLTQVQVQEHTGIHHKTLSGYENGVSKPDYEALNKLCDLFNVTTDWVLGNTNNPAGELTEAERTLVRNINLDNDSLLSVPMEIGGVELTESQKKKVLDMARLLLQQDR